MNRTHTINLLTPKSVAKILGTITILLICANLFFNVIKFITKDKYFYGLIPLFQLSAENNIPSFFSGCLFLISSIFLMLIWKVKRHYDKPRKIWGMLAFLFLFLAYDELFKVHELLIHPIRDMLHTTGLLYEAWIVVYGVAVLLLVAAFYPEWRRLQKKFRQWFSASAITFMSGAVGFEMIGGAYFESVDRKGDVIYGALYTIEESLEMAGLLIFIYSLMMLLESELDGAVISISETGHTVDT
jgi:hypothetical protein